MKKFLLYILMCAMLCCGAIGLSACASQRLPAPGYLKLDEQTLVLSWTSVKEAVEFKVKVDGKENTVRDTKYSLDYLDEGKHTVSVKAIGDGETFNDSKYSESIHFTKAHEDGLAHELMSDGLSYQISGAGNVMGDVVIEPEFRGLPVTAIKESAFANNVRITSIKIPDTVTSIGTRAFYNCTALTDVELPETIQKIGVSAFQRCRLITSFKIPEATESLGDYCFTNCTNLTEVTFNSNLKTIGKYAFSECQALGAISLPDSMESIDDRAFYNSDAITSFDSGNGLVRLGNFVFGSCSSLASIKLGSGLLAIGEGAFNGCVALSNVDLTGCASLQTIHSQAFKGCTELRAITIPSTVTVIDRNVFESCTALQDISLSRDLKYIGKDCFLNSLIYQAAKDIVYVDHWVVNNKDPELTSITLDSNTRGIAEYAFSNSEEKGRSDALLRIQIPDSVVYLNDFAFYELKALIDVEIGDGVKEIGYAFFSGCEKLGGVAIGKSVETIGVYAFSDCTNLVNVRFNPGAQLRVIGESAFQNDINIVTMVLPDTVEIIENYAFNGCSDLAFFNTPASIKQIGSYCFAGSNFYSGASVDSTGVVYVGNWVVGFVKDDVKTANVQIREGTVGIARYAFYNASNLISVRVPSSVKVMGDKAFYKCTELQTVEIAAGLTEIPEYAFYRCSKLQDVILPQTITSIGNYAFARCGGESQLEGNSGVWGLEKIDIPASVKSIGEYAFYNCVALKTVTLRNGLESVGAHAFKNCFNLLAITLPATNRTIGDRAFYGCTELRQASLGGLTEIGTFAFGNCVNLQRVSIPATLKTISDYAFYKCESLLNLDFGQGVEDIGAFAFYECKNLTDIYLPNTLKSIARFAFSKCTRITSVVLNENMVIADYAFYRCSSLTFYCGMESRPDSWGERWNSTSRPVIWGCQLSEDKTYVVSITVKESNFEHHDGIYEISVPNREGYKFSGWATTSGGSASYGAYDFEYKFDLAEGTVLYPVYY